MSERVIEAFSWGQISASANVSNSGDAPSSSRLAGIFVSAASSTPTITVYDSATTTTTAKVIDTFTPVAATFYRLPAKCINGIYVVISGTVSCTVFYDSP